MSYLDRARDPILQTLKDSAASKKAWLTRQRGAGSTAKDKGGGDAVGKEFSRRWRGAQVRDHFLKSLAGGAANISAAQHLGKLKIDGEAVYQSGTTLIGEAKLKDRVKSYLRAKQFKKSKQIGATSTYQDRHGNTIDVAVLKKRTEVRFK